MQVRNKDGSVKQSMIDRDPRGSNLNIKDRHIVNGVDVRLQNPDNVYVDVQLSNDNPDLAMIAQYSTTRNTPFVDKASDYYLAVARFEIPNNDIPLFLFQEDTYAVTMVNGGVSSRVVLTYTAPPGNLPNSIYTIQEFLDCFNNAITTACGNVGIAEIPRVFLDRNNQLQAIRFSSNANWLGAAMTPVWQLWMNWELFYFFQSMQVYFAGAFNPANGQAYRLLVKDNYDGNYVAGTSYTMSQETPLLSLYISILNVIVATTSLPVNAELIAIRKGDTSSTFNTIADFAPGQLANYSDNFTPYLYNPAFYRLIDLLSGSSLNKLDFQVYYIDADNNTSPLYLLPSQKLTVKFVFVKKALYNNQYN